MGQLTRKTKPLLRTAGGKQHASDNDHEPETTRPNAKPALSTYKTKRKSTYAEESIPTPDSGRSFLSTSSTHSKRRRMDADPNDVDRDPDSSSDVEEKKVNSSDNFSFRVPQALDLDEPEAPTSSSRSFKFPGASQDSRKSSKRASTDVEDDEDFPSWLKPPSQNKKPNVNIHASKPVKQTKYGKQSAPKSTIKKGFKRLASPKPSESPEKKGPAFKMPSTAFAIFEEPGPASFQSSFSSLARPDEGFHDIDDMDDTSSLSSADDSPGAEEINRLGLPDPQPYTSVVQCDLCEQDVPRMVFEGFIDHHNLEEPMPFKWKTRFCRYHKVERAIELRVAKGYPNVEWGRLGGRMRKHDEYLIAILNNTKGSHYRTAQRDKIQRRNKGVQRFQGKWDVEDDKPGASVGYYGPKGAKIMTDHIMDSLADELRERAPVDRLMSSHGVQGGVTGFVQAVLVPHLAELLIKDDMRLAGDNWSQTARDIIAESTELGELLNPAVRDEIEEVVSDDGNDD